MEGWLEYAWNGRMAGECQEWKDGWSMPGDRRMNGVYQEKAGLRECVRKRKDAGVCLKWKDG
jgi:hypothetical protein